MERQDFITALENNFKDCIEIVKKKNSDYAKDVDPFKNFRLSEFVGLCSLERAILVRMMDKIQRVVNLLDKEASVKDESIEDTLKDLINYANILLVYLKSRK